MLELVVVNFCGEPVHNISPVPLHRAREVNVGRSAECELVLPDADRHISRVQARISCDAQGALAVLNCSTVNSIFVNTAEVQPSERVAVQPADNIMIGLYELAFRQPVATAAVPVPVPAPSDAAPTARTLSAPVPEDAWSHLLDGIGTTSTRTAAGGGAEAALPPAPRPADRPAPLAQTPTAALWAQPLAPPPAPLAGLEDPLRLGSGPQGGVDLAAMLESSIPLDAILTLEPPRPVPFGADVLAPESREGVSLPGAQSADALGRLEEGWAAAGRSTDPMAGFDADRSARPPAFDGGTPIEVSDLAAVFDLPKLPSAGHELFAAPLPAIGAAPAAQVPPAHLPQAQAPSPPPPAPPPEPGPAPSLHDPLLAAFFEGAGWTKPLPAIEMDAAYMRRIGQLFKNTIEGSLDLALIQKEVKREIGSSSAGRTSGSSTNIFFAVSDIQSVLEHVLSKPHVGFADADATTRAVFHDFKLHEMATLAAVRATLVELMDLLAPVAIAKTDNPRSLLDTLAPTKEKARLWDRYTSTFADTFGDDREAMWSFVAKIYRRHYADEAATLAASFHPSE
ncbi:type VI secretion system-associated FHA domain protein [Sphingomonas sp. NCPPB 2930]